MRFEKKNETLIFRFPINQIKLPTFANVAGVSCGWEKKATAHFFYRSIRRTTTTTRTANRKYCCIVVCTFNLPVNLMSVFLSCNFFLPINNRVLDILRCMNLIRKKKHIYRHSTDTDRRSTCLHSAEPLTNIYELAFFLSQIANQRFSFFCDSRKLTNSEKKQIFSER